MKRILLASAAAVALIVLSPGESKAYWNNPGSNHGYCWLQGKALNFFSVMHLHGPLYSYGPYQGQGYAWMYVANPWCGAYTPAYPASYYGGYSVAPGTNFNYLPYPQGSLPQYSGIVEPPLLAEAMVQGSYPSADKDGPLETLPKLLALPKAPTSTSNYFGDQTPAYLSPPVR